MKQWMCPVWQRCIMGWSGLIGLRWLCGMCNERLPCWHDSFNSSAKLRWVRPKRDLLFLPRHLSENLTLAITGTIFSKKELISCHQANTSWRLQDGCAPFLDIYEGTNCKSLVVWFSLMVAYGGWDLWINYWSKIMGQISTTPHSAAAALPLHCTATHFTALWSTALHKTIGLNQRHCTKRKHSTALYLTLFNTALYEVQNINTRNCSGHHNSTTT